MTETLFQQDGYLKRCHAKVVSVNSAGICLDQTVFYATGGGQPGDSGHLILATGANIPIIDTYRDRESDDYIHAVESGSDLPMVGETIEAVIDWEKRHKYMRLHSALHMLCVAVDAPVTGGSIREDSARLDFDLPEPPDKAAIETELNRLISEHHEMDIEWISDDEMMARPELVRTMAVAPPMGNGQVRLVRFGQADLQPCGGTHVRSTEEIGPMRIQSIKKKGKQNRRITIEFT